MTKRWRWLCRLGLHYWMGCTVSYTDADTPDERQVRCRRCYIER